MCTCPNYMYWKGEWTKNDRPKLEFAGHHEYQKLIESSKEFANFPYIQVPCGVCLECRIQHARSWADRCCLESKESPHNYFVTLTYEDEHLPPNASLDPRDLQLFIKRLRAKFPKVKMKFLACGEYSPSLRPHYHLILFNCPLNDLSYEFYKEEDGHLVKHIRPPSKNNDIYWSKTIFDCWIETDEKRVLELGKSKGMISVGRFSYDTAAYVSQYVTKKCNPKMKSVYKDLHIYPEFLRMSKGIGKKYFEDHPDVHDNGKLVVPSSGSAHLSSVPRYFDKLFVKAYGQDIFDSTICQRRLAKKNQRFDTYIHSTHNLDKDNALRDYEIHKIHHMKTNLQ